MMVIALANLRLLPLQMEFNMTPASLKAWRERLSWNKTKAAEALGLSPNGYYAYEAGVRPIPRHVALACAAIVYGLPPLK